MKLHELKWKESRRVEGRICVVPLGSIEQHGYHLPMVTDTEIVTEVASRVEQALPELVLLLPTQWLGHSPHHRRFGCVSLDMRPYMEMIEGICRSLVLMGARKIFLLNGHGGNDIPCKAALRELKSEFEDMPELYIAYAAYWHLAAKRFTEIRESPRGGMGHACEMETSIMMKLRPELVEMEKAKPGGTYKETGYRLTDMLHGQPYYLLSEFHELSDNGTIGMPEFASAEKAEPFLTAAADAVVDFLKALHSWDFQEKAPIPERPPA